MNNDHEKTESQIANALDAALIPTGQPEQALENLVVALSSEPALAASVVELTEVREQELRELFKGVAVVIDDEVNNPESDIAKIVQQIEQGGGNVVKMTDLPATGYDFGNFTGVSFFVLDWQLHPTLLTDADANQAAVRPGAAFERQENRRKIDFLTKIMEHRIAPVFIFTSSDLQTVKEALASQEKLQTEAEHSHIMVGSKADVIAQRVFSVLVDWIHKRPSAYVLKTWEREYERAKNAMFNDLYIKSVDWPVLLWKTFKEDSLLASDEMGRLITRIIFSRMTPFHMDLDPFMQAERPRDEEQETAYRKKLLAVLEAERFVRVDGLHKDSIAPGDVFKLPKQRYLINIRPDCDCIDRSGNGDVELYLLQGSSLTTKQVVDMLDHERGLLREGEAEVAVFGMYEEKTIVFSMKKLEKNTWAEIKEKRIGRLLPPYLTRLQQRYASYLQRPGLSRIPSAAIGAKVAASLLTSTLEVAPAVATSVAQDAPPSLT